MQLILFESGNQISRLLIFFRNLMNPHYRNVK